MSTATLATRCWHANLESRAGGLPLIAMTRRGRAACVRRKNYADVRQLHDPIRLVRSRMNVGSRSSGRTSARLRRRVRRIMILMFFLFRWAWCSWPFSIQGRELHGSLLRINRRGVDLMKAFQRAFHREESISNARRLQIGNVPGRVTYSHRCAISKRNSRANS